MLKTLTDLITFKPLSGSRTKLVIAILGIGLGLHQVGLIPDSIWAEVQKYAPFILAYFGIEHADKLLGKKDA